MELNKPKNVSANDYDRVFEVVSFVSSNFALISFILIFISTIIAIIVLTSYVTVFDFSIIMLIEYSDIAKIAIIIFAIVVGIFPLISHYIQSFLDWAQAENKGSWIFNIRIIVATFFVWFAVDILNQ